MNQRTFRMRRRVGAALLAGVTALGVAAFAGGGVANAAAPTVTASAATATTSLGTATKQGSAITITITGSVSNPINSTDSIDLVLSCPSSGTVSFTAASTATSTALTSTPGTLTSNNQCGSNVKNVLPITWTGSSTSSATITVTPTYLLSGVPSGSLSLSGIYIQTSGSVSFTVPSDLTVANVTVTPAAPVSTVSPGTGDAAVNNLAISLPAVDTVGVNETVCVQLGNVTGATSAAGNAVTWDTIAGAPKVTQTNGAANATVAAVGSTSGSTSASATLTSTASGLNDTLAFNQVNESSLNAPTFTLSGLHVDVGANVTAGAATVSVWSVTNNDCATGSGSNGSSHTAPLVSGLTAFVVGSAPSTAIYGTNAEATAAAEFDNAFVSVSGGSATCTNNGNAVLATAADPYDALSASYLEGQLGTGVLITPPSSSGTIDPATLAALKYAGVQRVYVVGGPDAVTTAEINALANTPAYLCGGLATTGSNIVVEPAIYGQTADDTAQAIDNYLSNGVGGQGTPTLPTLAGAFSSASTYNQTTGNGSSAAPSATAKTAIVVSDTDWQDADTAAGIAYLYHLPVILTPGNALGAQASSELVTLGINQVIALGGNLALSNNVVTAIQALNGGISVLRVAGYDYTQTAADIAMLEGNVLGWKQTTLYVAQGTTAGNGWGDSLAAAPLSACGGTCPTGGAGASTVHEGILLTESPTAGEGTYTAAVLKAAGTPTNGLGSGLTTGIQVLGGPYAVTAATISAMQASLSSGAGA
ncbi:MAG: cell wall-binding repeat-containing protein [Actinomycetota bacterium]|nr:cell wall-binding repeat-containing protein [Actinomycetota bacterium]